MLNSAYRYFRSNITGILSNEVFEEIFFGCETYNQYIETAKVLSENKNLVLNLSFMKNTTSFEALILRLKIRIKLFERIPTATNMLLSYNLIEELMLSSFANGKDISNEVNKSIERFDKCKNLALGTKFINERKLTFSRSLDIFKKLTDITL